MAKITVETSNDLKRYDFSGAALPSGWTIASIGPGQSVSVASSVLSIVCGTGASEEVIVRCTVPITLKFLVRFVAMISQRIANQNIYFEVVNASGTTYARYDFNGTTATTAQCVTANEGTANTALSVTCPTTASYGLFDIFADTNDVFFSSIASNSNSAKSGVAKFDRNALIPDEQYYVQVRALNGATPPASSTTVSIDAVCLQDMTGLNVDLNRGDGIMGTSAAIPANVTNTVTTTTSLAPSTSQGSATFHHLISAATTNATSVKTSAGLLNEVSISNASASVRYFKLYNKASAPTVGTDTPIKTILIPAGQTVFLNGATYGLRLSTGIAYAVTGGITVADTTAIGANEVAVSMSYS